MGISQDKLSKFANVALQTITKIELGSAPNPRIKTASQIADAFGISIDDLIK